MLNEDQKDVLLFHLSNNNLEIIEIRNTKLVLPKIEFEIKKKHFM